MGLGESVNFGFALRVILSGIRNCALQVVLKNGARGMVTPCGDVVGEFVHARSVKSNLSASITFRDEAH